jgi:hypothetical protein
LLDFPDEDVLENQVNAAQSSHNKLEAVFSLESQAASILADAVRLMSTCMGSMRMVDLMEQRAFSSAQSLASRVQALVAQAQRINPAVNGIGPTNIEQG